MRSFVRLLLLVFALAWGSMVPVGAAGPYGGVRSDGQPFKWNNAQPIPYSVDQGSLGRLTNVEAVALFQAAAQRWDEVDTASISFAPAAPLQQDITGANVMAFLNNLAPGTNPIIFDSDGSVMKTLFGDATAAVAVGRPTTSDPATGTITGGYLILNGLYIDGRFDPDDLSLVDYRGMVVQEFGRFLGLGYSQLNIELIPDGIAENNNQIPQMYPRPVPGNGDELTADDRAAITALYPNPGLTGTYGKIRGQVLLPDGITGLAGINVIARRLGDPTVTAVSGITGIQFKNEIGGPGADGSRQIALRGAFEITDLPPGIYTLTIEALRPDSMAGPLAHPAFLPGGTQFYVAGGPATADPNAATQISLAPGQVVENANILVNAPAGPALQPLTEREPNEFPEQAQTLPLAARVQGAVQAGGATGVTVPLAGGASAPVQDLYRITLNQATLLTATLTAVTPGADLSLYLLSGPVATAPKLEAISADPGTPPESFQLRVPGRVYFLAISHAGGPGTAYTLDLNGTAAPDVPIPAPQKPRLNNLFVVNVSQTTAAASFSSDLPSNTLLYVSNPLTEFSNPTPVTDHRQGLTNLAPGSAFRLRTLAVTPNLGIGSLPDVFFTSALPALPGGVGQVFAGVTDIIDDPDDPNAAYVVLSFRNVGTGDASGVTITNLTAPNGWTFSDPIPTPIGLGFLGRGGSGVILTRLVRSGPTDNAPILSGTGTYNSQGVGQQQFTFGGAVAFLTIQKSVTPSTARPGDIVTFTLSAINGGQGQATSVLLSDTLPAGLTFIDAANGGQFQNGSIFWNLGSLAANGVVTVSFRARVATNAANGSTITNVALARSNETPTPIASNVVPLTIAAPPPQLQITKQANRQTAGPGEVITYTLGYSNVGGAPASNVIVTDSLPAGTVFVDASGAFSVSGGVVTWTIGALGPNQNGSQTLRVQVAPNTPGGTIIQNTGQIAAAEAPAAVTSNPAVVSVTAPPLLQVTKSANPTSARPGDIITYSLTVANVGSGPATNVRLFDQVPGNTTFIDSVNGAVQSGQVVWNLGTLAPGGSATVSFRVQVQPSVADQSVINNIALAISQEIPNGVASNNVAVGIIASPQLQLVKSASVNQARVGDVITFSLSLTNSGAGPATNVQIFDQVPTGTTYVDSVNGSLQSGQVVWNLGTVGPGGSATVSFRAQVLNSAATAGSINNIAQVRSAEVPNGLASNSVSVTITAPPPQLRLTKSASAAQARPGDLVTYTLTVANLGGGAATSVELFDPIPSGTTVQGVTNGGGYANATTIGWNLGTIPAGTTATVQLQVRVGGNVPNGTQLSNVAQVRSAEVPSFVPSNGGVPVVVTVVSPPQLQLTKQADRQTAAPNDTITYSLSFQNSGPGQATGVQLTEAIPPGTQYVSAPGGVFNGNSVVWNLGTLQAGGSGTRTMQVRVVNGTPSGTPIVNTAQLSSQEAPAVASNSVTVTVSVPATPQLQVQKNVDRAQASPNDLLTYQITFFNTGNGAANNVSLQDQLPTNTTFVSASSNGVPFGGTVFWNFNSLQPGQQSTVTLQVRVNPGTPNGTQIANSARIASAELQSVVSNVVTTNIIVVAPPPALQIQKQADVGTAQPGGLINYAITVANVGGSPATGVTVSDNVPSGTTGVVVFDGGFLSFGVAQWNLGTLQVGEQRQVHLRVQVNGNATGTIINTAQTRSNEVPTPVVSGPVAVTISIPLNVTIQKTVDKTTASPNTDLRYDISFRNNGAVTISGATVTDTLPAGVQFLLASQGVTPVGNTLTWNLPALGPGQTSSVTVNVRINPGTPEGTQIVNQASFNVPAQQFTVTSNPVTTTVTVPLNLTVQKQVNLQTAAPGDELQYVIGFRNNGAATVTGAVIRDQIPTGVQFVVASQGVVPQNGALVWNLPAINPGADGSVAFRVRILQSTPGGTQIANQANLSVPARGFSLDSNVVSTTVQAQAIALTLNKQVDKQSAPANDLLTYTLTFTNNGQQTFSQLQIVDPLPQNTTFDSADNNGLFTLGSVRWQLPQVGPGQSGVVHFSVRINPGTPLNTAIANQGRIGGPEVPQAINSNSVSTTVSQVAPIQVTLNKQVDKQTAQAGDLLTYTLTYANNGPQTFTQVTIADTIPANTTVQSLDNSGQVIGNEVRWQLAQLGPGQSGTVSFIVQINPGTPNSTTISNQGRISSQGIGNPINSNTVNTTVSQAAPIQVTLVKQVDKQTAQAGDLLTYTHTFTNNGPQTFTQAGVRDEIPANTSFVSANNGGQLVGNEVRFPTFTLGPGASGSVSFTVRINPGVPQGTVIPNQGRIVSPDFGKDVFSTMVSTTVTNAPPVALTLNKQVDKQTAPANDLLTYTLTYTNNGQQTFNQLQIVDPLPQNTTFDSADNGGQLNAGSVRWQLPQVGPGGSGAVHFSVRINPGTADNTVIANQGRIGGPEVPQAINSNTVNTTVGQAQGGSSFAGTWFAVPPTDHAASLTVDSQNKFTVWAVSKDRTTVARSAQGHLNPDGSFDVFSSDNLVHFTGQIAPDGQSAQITAERTGFVSFTVTAPRAPDVGPLPNNLVGTWNGFGVAANLDRLQVVLSIDPGGNATFQDILILHNSATNRLQFADFYVTPDGRVINPSGNQQVGTLVQQGNQFVLNYSFQSTNPTPYQNTFQVTLQPLP